jgi:hypothetical protein
MTKSEVKTITEQKVDIHLTTSKLSLHRKNIREENMENMLTYADLYISDTEQKRASL